MSKDTLFSQPQGQVAPFEFNDRVVEVFDDMLARSVPFYAECLRRQAQLAARYYQDGSRLYDLGCSNGNFGMLLRRQLEEREFSMVGVDLSRPMLDAYRGRLQACGEERRIRLEQGDIRQVSLADASVVVVNLTLQFLPLADRDSLVHRICRALRPGGVLLLTEKVMHEDLLFTELEQEFYYRFKQENGYSQLEISQKREALENVLIPETLEAHQRRLRQAGFEAVEIWFKWFNFAALLARKAV
ncbi:MAG: carboxy-S-adenosyl-L-methionine synthase CmoA [Desulfuromonadaceae bacterium]